jgi:hypothetical protein
MSHQRYKLGIIIRKDVAQELHTALNVLLEPLSSIRLPQFILRRDVVFNPKSRVCRANPGATTSFVARMHAEPFADLLLDNGSYGSWGKGVFSRAQASP